MTSSNAVNFVDIHTHILPGIDDGAKNTDESLAIIRAASKAGVKRMVATPHVFMENTRSVLDAAEKSFDTLKIETARHGIDIELSLGAEVSLGAGLSEEVKKDRRLTIGGGGKYILFEMPFFEVPFYARKTIFDLLVSGVTPIWAHPERCRDVIDDFNSVRAFTDNGVKLQINSGSLAGVYGRKVKHTAIKLVENGLGDIIASDTHSPDEADKSLSIGYSNIVKIAGKQRALEMCEMTPLLVTGAINREII